MKQAALVNKVVRSSFLRIMMHGYMYLLLFQGGDPQVITGILSHVCAHVKPFWKTPRDLVVCRVLFDMDSN